MATTVLGLKTFAASDPVDYNEINDNYNKIDNGVKTAFQGRAAHNWMDNSWFVNPVNQRGQTSYNAGGYSIDRWNFYNPNGDGIVTINNGYISLTGGSGAVSLSCRFPKGFLDANKTYTARICDNLGNINPASLIFYDGFDSFEISAGAGETKNIVWAALYEGSYTADTLPAYQPKGYAAELAECQRYYIHCGEGSWMTGLYKAGEGLIVEIPTANNIRIPNPTIIVNSPKVFTTNGWYDITYASCTVTKCWTKLLFNIPEAASQFMSYYGAYIITGIVGVSADL